MALALKRRLADLIQPWAMGNATKWPSLHAQHAGLLEEVKEHYRNCELYREAWVETGKELTAARIRLGKAEMAAAKWQQAFNSLEKPITDHIEKCMDSDDLKRAHGAVMKRFGPGGSGG
jgi:hypothetical protein